jgi:Holliday junction resolvasome RuvABC endonuclease subunit
LAFLYEALTAVLTAYPPRFAAVEGYSYDSVNKAFTLGEVGGICRLCCFVCGVPLVVVQPSALKKFVTGNGASDKDHVRACACEKWGAAAEIDQHDKADAYGLAHVARVFHTRDTANRKELEVVCALAKQFPPT